MVIYDLCFSVNELISLLLFIFVLNCLLLFSPFFCYCFLSVDGEGDVCEGDEKYEDVWHCADG